MITRILLALAIAFGVIAAPVIVSSSQSEEQFTWSDFHADAVAEYADEFTALFNSYDYKLSKNGRSMINGKFVKMAS